VLSPVSRWEGEPPPRKTRGELQSLLEPPSRLLDITPEPVCFFPGLYVVLFMPNNMLNPVLSHATRTLQSKGVRYIATEVAARDLPLAGRMKHFLPNWQAITRDEWMLTTVMGYRIEFLQKPHQNRKPPQIAFTGKEEECM